MPRFARRSTSVQFTAARSVRVRGAYAMKRAAYEFASFTTSSRVMAWNSHASTGSEKFDTPAKAIASSSCAIAAVTTSGYGWKFGDDTVSSASFSSITTALSK